MSQENSEPTPDTSRLHTDCGEAYCAEETCTLRETHFQDTRDHLQAPHLHREKRTHWFEDQVALDVLRYRFQQGKHTIRIATGFFTIRGYNLLRRAARQKQLLILVGIDEPGEQRVREALKSEIMRDLRTGLDPERRGAVQELVERMRGGHFQIVDARAMPHHAKLYIIDDAVVVHGSSNMTGRGLQEAIESGDVIEDRQKVADFIRDYSRYFCDPRCVLLTQELLDTFQKWLAMASPWDVYIKTLSSVKSLGDTHIQRAAYRKPVGYQQMVIARALRQIEQWRGAMVVASTGLGKTIIGTDIALRLHEQGEILNVMVLGPKTVAKEWRARLSSAGLSCDFFIHQILDTSTKQQWQEVGELEAKLREMDHQWLIIIDESHEFRNRFKLDVFGNPIEERQAFKRLVPAIARSTCKVLLLTGTPYSKDVENINHQLYLLPHTAPPPVLPIFEDLFGRGPWRVEQLSDLRNSPVGSVITTPHVAKYYGVAHKNEIAIDFHGTFRYIPHVFLYGVGVPPLLEQEIASALDEGYFRVNAHPLNWKILTSIERILRIAWGSSPWALGEVLANVVETGRDVYKVTFLHPLKDRRRKLLPILDALYQLTTAEDTKLQWLCNELRTLCAQGQKVIVFSERLETVVYLEQALAEWLPELRIASTVRNVPKPSKRGHKQKSFRTIHQMLAYFDPTAPVSEAQPYHVLLSTDAFGIGVNLHKAQTVINYDLAWTPIEPAQRAGRVLRLVDEPRTVHLYTLFPIASPEVHYGRIAQRLLKRTEMLTERHEHATSLLDLPTITTKKEYALHLPSLASPVSIVDYGEVSMEDIEKLAVSSLFEHVAVLESWKKEAQGLPNDLMSAMQYPGKQTLVYVLLFYCEKYYWPLYNVKEHQLRTPPDISGILDLIKCSKETPLAFISPEEVEYWSHVCIETWCQQQNIPSDEVERICALYLMPQGKEESF